MFWHLRRDNTWAAAMSLMVGMPRCSASRLPKSSRPWRVILHDRLVTVSFAFHHLFHTFPATFGLLEIAPISHTTCLVAGAPLPSSRQPRAPSQPIYHHHNV
jgi:hypothetical protein